MTDANVPASTPPPSPPPAPAAAPEAAPTEPSVLMPADVQDILKHRPMAILSYVGPLVLIPLLTTRDSPFTRFHSQQGLRLFICEVVVAVAVTLYWGIGAFAMYLVTGVATWLWIHGGACLGATLGLAAYATSLALALIGIVHAANGETKPLPLISRFNLFKLPGAAAPAKT